jgi:hypothetical protein
VFSLEDLSHSGESLGARWIPAFAGMTEEMVRPHATFCAAAHGAGLRTAVPDRAFDGQRELAGQFEHAGVTGVGVFAFLVDVENGMRAFIAV